MLAMKQWVGQSPEQVEPKTRKSQNLRRRERDLGHDPRSHFQGPIERRCLQHTVHSRKSFWYRAWMRPKVQGLEAWSNCWCVPILMRYTVRYVYCTVYCEHGSPQKRCTALYDGSILCWTSLTWNTCRVHLPRTIALRKDAGRWIADPQSVYDSLSEALQQDGKQVSIPDLYWLKDELLSLAGIE